MNLYITVMFSLQTILDYQYFITINLQISTNNYKNVKYNITVCEQKQISKKM